MHRLGRPQPQLPLHHRFVLQNLTYRHSTCTSGAAALWWGSSSLQNFMRTPGHMQPIAPEDPNNEFAQATTDTGGAGGIGEGPRIINVGVPGPGVKRQLWRRAWRDKVGCQKARGRTEDSAMMCQRAKKRRCQSGLLYPARQGPSVPPACTQILPAVANFGPDMIFLSAGFDAHKKVSGWGRASST